MPLHINIPILRPQLNDCQFNPSAIVIASLKSDIDVKIRPN